MIKDSRFWIFLLILFFSAYTMSEAAGRIRKKRNPGRLFYMAAALASSIGLWLCIPGLWDWSSELFHISNGIALLLGVFIALFPYLFFIPLLLPFFLFYFFHQPLKPFFPEEEPELGTLLFLPSENNQMKLIWDDGEEETLITLQGEKAALSIMSCKARSAFFFLKDRYLVLGVGSVAVSPGDLSEIDDRSFFSLNKLSDGAERFYQIHYPAQRFIEPGYFEAWNYSVRDGDIAVQRK